MDGAIWSLEDIWDYYYAVYYDLTNQAKNNTNEKDTEIHAPSSAVEMKQSALSDEHFDSLSDFLKKPKPEGFPNMETLFDLKNLEALHKGLAQITSFRTDLDALSDDVRNLVKTMIIAANYLRLIFNFHIRKPRFWKWSATRYPRTAFCATLPIALKESNT
jgi:hypothetical protein